MADLFLVKKPLITEKATTLGTTFGKYVFLVANNASSPEIKKVIEATYKVKVAGVSVINTPEKKRRLGRSMGVKAGYKKRSSL